MFDHAIEVKERHENELLRRDFVHGVGVGADQGRPAIKVYVDALPPGAAYDLPAELDDVPVVVEVSGPFRAA
jgi:hypothetical protein